jgi:2-phosphosulfolactate phosphatase
MIKRMNGGMNIQILRGEAGAAKAKGITVVIDVFRAFTLEAMLLKQGCEKILATDSEETARKLKEEHPDWLLIGERHGKILPGFDYGNAPSAIEDIDFTGKTCVHTTTNGTQGLARAVHAQELLAGSLLNAKATAAYIRAQQPAEVSLCAMGWEGKDTEEDLLCADYLYALLQGEDLPDLKARELTLKETEGKKFFDPDQQEVFPERDFWLCIENDTCDFAITCVKEAGWFVCTRKDVHA